MLFTPEEHARISAAIAAAESRTSGEIFAVVDTKPTRYRYTRLVAAWLIAFILPPALVLAGFDPLALFTLGSSGWEVGNATPPSLRQEILAYFSLQCLIGLALLLLIGMIPSL